MAEGENGQISVKYRQEKIGAAIYLVSMVLFGAAVVFLVSGWKLVREGQSPVIAILIPLLCLSVGAVVLVHGIRKAKQEKAELMDIRKNGQQLSGEILDVEEHVETYSDGDGGTNREYSYNFVVRYTDPVTLSPVVAESITTYRKYEVKDPRCLIRIYEGKVLVEKIYAEEKKRRTFLPALLFFLLAAAFLAAKWQGWF